MQKLGYYLPFAAAGSAISAVGNGLVTMFAPSTPTGKWIGYQIVLGSGRGIGMQMVRCPFMNYTLLQHTTSLSLPSRHQANKVQGIIAIQNHLPVHLIPVGIAFMIFCQNFAGAVFVVVAEVIFRQQLVKEIRLHAPQVSVDAALAAGASASSVRALVPEGSGSSAELAGVLLAFANSLDKVFYLLMACCLTGFVAAFGMGWVDVRKKKTIAEGEEGK